MIFSKFRKPRWQHQDMTVRCEAVLELDRDKQKDKDILRELAFNDGEHSVRLTALRQLDDFNLCWMALQQDKDKRVRQWCHKQIEQQLIATDKPLSDTAISQFIEECRDGKFLESVWRKLPAASHRVAVLHKLNKCALYIEAVVNEQELAIRESLAAKLSGKDELQRLLKKLKPADPLHKSITEQVEAILEQEARPDEVRQELLQVKAIFNAVKEKHDYKAADARLQRNLARWHTLQTELQWLPEPERQAAVNAVTNLIASASEYVSHLQAQWQQVHAEELLKQRLEQQAQQLTEQWQQLSETLQQVVADQEWSAQPRLLEGLAAFSAQVDDSELTAKLKEQWQAKLLGLRQHVEKLALIPDALTRLSELLDKVEAMPLPDSDAEVTEWEQAKQGYSEWKQQWQAGVKGLETFIPAPLETRFQSLNAAWRDYIEQAGKAIQQRVKRTQHKLSELNRLLDHGRSRDANGLLKKIETWYQTLPQADMQRLARRMEQVRARVADISDWKAYAGAPKKEQLIRDIALLVDSPLADPQLQAQQIKDARATWQTLGQLDTEEDQIFNKAFNELCEKAFQPCREYYQAQEVQRAAALQERQALCAEMEALGVSLTEQEAPDWRMAESEFHRLNNQWRQAGNVEREAKQAIFDRYREASNQLRLQLKSWHEQNLQQKQALLDEACHAASDESMPLYQRAEQIKAIQQRWKQIGYAGKADQSVWQAFRTCCDELFAKLKEENSERRQQHDTLKSELLSRIQQLSTRADSGEDKQAILAEITTLETDIESAEALHGNERKQLLARSDELQQRLTQALRKASLSREGAVIAAVLHNRPDDSLNHPWLALSQAYPQQPAEAQARLELVLEAEILTDSDSPETDKSLRQQVQLKLLANGASIGSRLDVQAFLKRWVAAGALSEQDNPLAERLKAALLNGLL